MSDGLPGDNSKDAVDDPKGARESDNLLEKAGDAVTHVLDGEEKDGADRTER